MLDTLPLFKSHYSIGRSILTLKSPEDMVPNGPDSIFDICLKNDLDELILVDDNMSGFLEAYTRAKKLGLTLRYGLRLGVNNDYEEKSKDSLSKTAKYIIFPKNTEGFQRLIKIYSFAAKEGFYYVPRIDFKTLKKFWSNKELSLVIPFYDSFIFNNVLAGFNCVPEINFTEPKFFLEDNRLPFDDLMRQKVLLYAEKEHQIFKTKSIYYNLRKDFKSYLTFRCINNRSTLEKPNLNHMCSDEFSFESWKEQNVTAN